MIKFLNVHIYAFRSVRDKVRKLDSGDAILFYGRNGVGKSSMMEALYWCLYGKTIHGNSPIPWDGTECSVSVEFKSGNTKYKVLRKHNGKKLKLVLYKSGKIISENNSTDTMKMLYDMFPAPDIFQSLVWCGQDVPRFIDQDAKSRRQIWSDLFGFNKWEAVRVYTREQLRKVESDAQSYEVRIADAQRHLSLLQEKLLADKQVLKTNIDTNFGYDDKIKQGTARIEEIINELSEYGYQLSLNADSKLYVVDDRLNKDIELARAEYEKAKNSLNIVGNQIAIQKQQSDNYEKDVSLLTDKGICPVCHRPAGDSLLAQLRNSWNTVKADLVRYTEVYDREKSNFTQLTAVKDVLDKMVNLVSEVKKINDSVADTDTAVSKMRELSEKEITDTEAKMRTYIDDLETWERELVELEQQTSDLSFWHSAFRSNGVTNLQLSAISGNFNAFLAKYVPIFFDDMVVKLVTQRKLKSGGTAEDFNLEVQWRGTESSYSDFSGGERSRLELCVMLARQSMAMGEWDCNIRVYDEVFDQLDESGVAGVSRLIQDNNREGVSSFIVTHNQHIKSLFEQTQEVK